jgi:hypothetical protein
MTQYAPSGARWPVRNHSGMRSHEWSSKLQRTEDINRDDAVVLLKTYRLRNTWHVRARSKVGKAPIL